MPTSPRRMMIAGLIVVIVSGFSALVFLVAAVLTANPCGAFGDACDDNGTTPAAFFVMLTLRSWRSWHSSVALCSWSKV